MHRRNMLLKGELETIWEEISDSHSDEYE